MRGLRGRAEVEVSEGKRGDFPHLSQPHSCTPPFPPPAPPSPPPHLQVGGTEIQLLLKQDFVLRRERGMAGGEGGRVKKVKDAVYENLRV